MDSQLRRGFRIGAFDIEPLTGRIAGPSGETRVQPKVMDVLVFLAERAGDLVERETLLNSVWGRVTSEEVLTRCISELRSALGDERDRPRYIQTVPKRGYRLLERIEPKEAARPTVNEPAARPTAAQLAADAPVRPPSPNAAMASIGVLPFEIHSMDPAHQFLGDAFAAELQSTLARVDRLRVASRRSSFAFKSSVADVREIGAKLNVGYVITGSIRGNGRSVRVVAELNDSVSGMQVWAESYERSSDDLLAVEKEITAAIVGSFTAVQLRDELASVRHKPASSLDAWELVQKARALALDYTPAAFEQAIELARRAIELDESYAVAHGVLASLLIERLINGASSAAGDEASAVAAAETALTLAPQDPLLLKMVSLVFTYCGDSPKAIACLRKAVKYAPFDFGAWGYMGWPLTSTGDAKDLEELRAILDRLIALVPQHPGVSFWYYHKSVAETCVGDFNRARESAETALELRPAFALGWMHYSNVLGHLGAKSEAAQALRRGRDLNPAMTPKHFESLIRKISVGADLIGRRVGGLLAIRVPRP